MSQPKYIEQFKTIKTSLRIENGWGISGNKFYSPVLIQSWISDQLITDKGQLTERGKAYVK